MRKLSPHLKQVRQCDPDLSVFKRVIKGSEEKSCPLLEPELNIYVSSRNWINHSSAASLPTQLGVLWWKQTGLSSDSALDWYTPGFPKKTKHDGVLWEQRVAGGRWHAFLKRLRLRERPSDRWKLGDLSLPDTFTINTTDSWSRRWDFK